MFLKFARSGCKMNKLHIKICFKATQHLQSHGNLHFLLPPLIFSSPEPKAQVELIVWDSSRRPSVHPSVSPSVRPSTLSKINISETSWPIVIKFYQKHHWGGGLAALRFGPDRIRTLVSMATDSSHRVIMGKTL